MLTDAVNIKDAFIIQPEIHSDHRGYSLETYSNKDYADILNLDTFSFKKKIPKIVAIIILDSLNDATYPAGKYLKDHNIIA